MGSSVSSFVQTGTPTPPPEPIATSCDYDFPQDKLIRRITDSTKKPLVLVSCGSFSPPTILHLQMFEMAERYIAETPYELVGSYMSPCSFSYGKESLVADNYRIDMCNLAIKHETKSRIMVDTFETSRFDDDGKPLYTRTADVLRHFDHEINDVLGGIEMPDGTMCRAQVMLLIGADLAQTMGDPKIWSPADIDVLLGYYGAFIVERAAQCDLEEAIKPLEKYRDNLWLVPSFENEVSSTRIRAQLKNGEISFDLPNSVFEYIKEHRLYQSGNAKK